MEAIIIRIYKFLNRNWNTIVAAVATIGLLIIAVTPSISDKTEYSILFAWLLGTAIVWTLIELKIKLLGSPKVMRYESMREARPNIVAAIKDAINNSSSKKVLEIKIVGGRIRTISDILREIKNEIQNGRLKGKKVKFQICCLNPDYINSMDLYGIKRKKEFSDKYKTYSNMIHQFSKELVAFNQLASFVENNISVEVYHYTTVPYIYCFLIGESSLFWGYFTWDQDEEDFIGPENPCSCSERDSNDFDELYKWLLNQTIFLQHTVGKEYRPDDI